MKVMSRNFTLMEKILIAALALILVGLVYYRFIDQDVRSSIAASEAEAQDLQTQIDGVQARLAYLQGLKNNMDELEASGNLSWMGSYNNSPEELVFLNAILGDALEYSISFSNVTRTGDQIRRSFTLQYRTADYESAQAIMRNLLHGKNRCVVGDVRCSIAADGSVTMNESATFYETMVGGIPDAALPADSAAVNR